MVLIASWQHHDCIDQLCACWPLTGARQLHGDVNMAVSAGLGNATHTDVPALIFQDDAVLDICS